MSPEASDPSPAGASGHGPDTSRYTDYLLTNRDFTAPAVASAIAAIGRSQGAAPRRVLDAGTGAGGALPALVSYAAGGSVLAIDLDDRAIELAGGYAAQHGIRDAVELRVADLHEIANRTTTDVWEDVWEDVCEDATAGSALSRGFDLIWSSDVVWPATFEDPAGVVRTLAGALARGGTLALFTTNYYQSMFLPGHSRLERLIRTASELTWGLPGDGAVHYELLGAWLRQAGLADVRLRVFPIATASVIADPAAAAYLTQIVWPEMRHAARSNGPAAGMSGTDLARVEELLDPESPTWIGHDPDAYTVQPTLLWTGRCDH